MPHRPDLRFGYCTHILILINQEDPEWGQELKTISTGIHLIPMYFDMQIYSLWLVDKLSEIGSALVNFSPLIFSTLFMYFFVLIFGLELAFPSSKETYRFARRNQTNHRFGISYTTLFSNLLSSLSILSCLSYAIFGRLGLSRKWTCTAFSRDRQILKALRSWLQDPKTKKS